MRNFDETLADLRREMEDDQALPHLSSFKMPWTTYGPDLAPGATKDVAIVYGEIPSRRPKRRWWWPFVLVLPLLAGCSGSSPFDIEACEVWEVESELTAVEFVAAHSDELNESMGDRPCVVLYVYNPDTGKFGRIRLSR